MPALDFPESSNIKSLEYRPDEEALYAVFRGHGRKDGSRSPDAAYRYESVAPRVWEQLDQAGREGLIGQAFQRLVRTAPYRYVKLDEYEPPDDIQELRRCICNPEVFRVYGVHQQDCPIFQPGQTMVVTPPPPRRSIGRRGNG